MANVEGTAAASRWSITSIVGEAPTLCVATVEADTVILGSFQRRDGTLAEGATMETRRRRTGGRACLAAAGTVHVLLCLPRSDSLVPGAKINQLVNRHVRPLLGALRGMGLAAAYFGRDEVVVEKRSLAFVGFAHHAASGACLFEALIAVKRTLRLPDGLDAAPTLDDARDACSLEALSARLPSEDAAERIARSYLQAYPGLRREQLPAAGRLALVDDHRPRFAVRTRAPIGWIGATAGKAGGEDEPGLGGDLLASEEVITLATAALRARDPAAFRQALEAGVVDGVRVETLYELAARALADQNV